MNFKKVEFLSDGPQVTFELAKKFAKELGPGSFVAMFGGLGAGKTVFVKGLCEGLGFCGNVSSPTFALINEYMVKEAELNCQQESGFSIVHCDMYRIDSELDLESIGFFDYLGNPNIIMVVEWSENIINFLPAGYYKVQMGRVDENKRLIKIEKKGKG